MRSAPAHCAQQQQGIVSSSSQHIIQCDEQPPPKRIEEVLATTTASNATCHLPSSVPAPAKFQRKAACFDRADKTSIGCQIQDNAKWLKWTPKSKEIKAMHADASAWWALHGPAVKATIRVVMLKAKEGASK